MTDSEKLDLLIGEMRGMKQDVQDLKGDVQGLKSDVKSLNNRMDKIEYSVKSINLHLENVTDRNILIIAEAHHDLNRKLDEALRVKNLKEVVGHKKSY